MKISVTTNTMGRQRQVCYVQFLRNLSSILLWNFVKQNSELQDCLLSVKSYLKNTIEKLIEKLETLSLK